MDLFIRQVANEHRGDWAQTTRDIETFLNEMARMAGKKEEWGYIRVEIPVKTNRASYDTCHGFIMLENPEHNEQVIELVNNTPYKGRKIIVQRQENVKEPRISMLKTEHQESRSRSTSRTRQELDWDYRASKRKSVEDEEETKNLKNKVSKLTVQVKELELQALKLDQAKEEEEEMNEMREHDKLRLQDELRLAVNRINQVEQERNDLRAENHALKRKISELLRTAAIQEARNAIQTTSNKQETSKQA